GGGDSVEHTFADLGIYTVSLFVEDADGQSNTLQRLVYVDGAGTSCGNGTCETGETCSICATDCGACETCSDGIQNQDETGTDCGGSICPPCESCSDGVQNGDEEGIDCSGSVCPP